MTRDEWITRLRETPPLGSPSLTLSPSERVELADIIGAVWTDRGAYSIAEINGLSLCVEQYSSEGFQWDVRTRSGHRVWWGFEDDLAAAKRAAEESAKGAE